jgi:hypothetical protein
MLPAYQQQPIVIKTGGSRSYSRKRKYPSKKFKKYKRRYWNAEKLKKAIMAEMPRGTEASEGFWGKTYADGTDRQKMYRKALGFRGAGDYGWQGSLLRGAGETLGSLWGNRQGGRSIGANVSKFFGWGDYGGDAGGNQIMAGSAHTPLSVNQDSNNLQGDVYLSHREFLQNVTATGGGGNISPFSLVSFPINVGMNTTFPWLSQIAENFTMYELQGCIFEFKPTSGELGATGTHSLGKAVMATQYDPDAPAFTSTVQMENYDYANACKPSEHMLHGVETAVGQRATNLLYVRTGVSPKDKVFTDVGNFQIATEGLPITSGTTAVVGELWVAYRVKLSRAQLFSNLLGASIPTDWLLGYTAAGGGSLFTATSQQLQSNGQAYSYDLNSFVSGQLARKKTNNLGVNVAYATGAPTTSFQVIFPANIVSGTYQITVLDTHIDNAGTGASWTGIIQPSGYAYCSLVGTWNAPSTTANGVFPWGAPSSSATPVGTGTSTSIIVNISAPGNNIAIVTMLFNSAPAASHYTAVLVTQVNSAITLA